METGIYIHVPFCQAKCRYCGFLSYPIAQHDCRSVVKAMIMEMTGSGRCRDAATIYIGGGSPSCLPREDLLALAGNASRLCPGAVEFTVEVNPGQVDWELLSGLRTAGVNRLSIGGQSFVQRELHFLGRGHDAMHIRRAVGLARDAGFENIGLDLIYAVPGSTIDHWRRNLTETIELGVDHVSAYALSYEEGTALHRDLAAGVFEAVDEDTDRAMYEMAIDELEQAGLGRYEISNFAKPALQCRHNLNYWANGEYAGFGPGATSFIDGVRSTNCADIAGYLEAVKTGRKAATGGRAAGGLDRACETAVLNLRRRLGINLEQFRRQTGHDALQLFAEPIGRYLSMGLMGMDCGCLFLTRDALGVADSILCDFTGGCP